MHSVFTLKSNRTPVYVVYVLLAVSVFTFFPLFIAGLVAWMNLDNETDSLLRTHYKWQMRTFWTALVVFAVGSALTVVLVGYLVLVLLELWLIYRVAIGWYFLSENQPPKGFLFKIAMQLRGKWKTMQRKR